MQKRIKTPMKGDPAHNWKAYKGGERKLGASAAPSGGPERLLGPKAPETQRILWEGRAAPKPYVKATIGGSILPSSSPQILPSSSPQILEPIVTTKGTLQVQEMFHLDTHGLFVDSRLVAMHPNGFSCRSLAERIASGDEERVRQQAQYILDCGGMTIALDALVWYARPIAP